MFVLVTYDIKDDKKRNKVCNILKNYGNRVQYSVFECDINEKIYKRMINKILPYINNDEDSLRLYHLCNGCIKKIESYGVKKYIEKDKDTIIL